jgi:hypothetical protein
MEPGKPDAGKPPVRFDEGRESGGHWVQTLSSRWLLPTLHKFETGGGGGQRQSHLSSDMLAILSTASRTSATAGSV